MIWYTLIDKKRPRLKSLQRWRGLVLFRTRKQAEGWLPLYPGHVVAAVRVEIVSEKAS